MTLNPTRLKEIRKSLDWSMAQTGEYMGYAKYQIQHFEDGRKPITELFKEKLIKAIKKQNKEGEKIIASLLK